MRNKLAARWIADVIRTEWTDEAETIQDFCLRRLSDVTCGEMSDALKLLMARERGTQDIGAMIDIVDVGTAAAAIVDLIEHSRAKGYRADLESLLARPWVCPHCNFRGSLLNGVMIPVPPTGWPACKVCGEEDIAPLEAEADLTLVEGGKR